MQTALLADEFVQTLARALDGATTCALVGHPAYGNVGDHAIWLGQVAALERLGVRIAYVADRFSYSAAALRRAAHDGPILIQGGGSLGDLWPQEQAFRERVIVDAIGRPIVQLPQSVWFENSQAALHFDSIVSRHGGVLIMARDAASLDRLSGVPAQVIVLSPDAAFALADGLVLPFADRRQAGVAVLRRDQERAVALSDVRLSDLGITAAPDWAGSILSSRRHRLASWVGARPSRARSMRRLARGLSDIRVRYVVTDRLHCHILCMLTGTPHVILDNSYGKVGDFMRTWTGTVPYAALVNHPDAISDALAEVQR